MVRYIFSMHPRDHVGTEHLLKLSWLRVSDRVRYFRLWHVFSIRNGLAPGYLSLNFVPVSTRHNHHTRGSQMNYAISKRFSNAPLVLLSRPLLNGMLCQLIWNRSNPSLFSRNGWNSIYLLLTEDRSNVTCHLPLAFSHTIVFTAKIIFYWFMFHEDPDGNKSPDFSGLSSSIALTIAKLCPVLYWNRIHSFIHSFKALNPNDPNNNFCISTPLDTQTRNVLDNALNWFPTPPAVEQNKSCFDLAGQLWALWCFRFCSVFKYCSRPDRYEQLVP